MVVPWSRFIERNKSNISMAIWLSNSPVGSSASNKGGVFDSATPMAVRCCSPPDS